jgi:RNA polymerase sigma-70 factor, ECF subfamily
MARSLTEPSEERSEPADPVEGSGPERPSGVVRSESALSGASIAAHALGLDMNVPAELEAGDECEQAPDFERIYAQYFQRVSQWLRACGGLDADIDDLAQEVFLVVQRRLSSYRGPSMAAWLYGIARRTASDQRRRAWLRRWLRGVDPDQTRAPSAVADPCETLERREARRRLSAILNQMSAVRRSTFILFEIEGYSGEEIAALEGVSVNTVYTRLHHARKDLLRLMAAQRESGGAA